MSKNRPKDVSGKRDEYMGERIVTEGYIEKKRQEFYKEWFKYVKEDYE